MCSAGGSNCLCLTELTVETTLCLHFEPVQKRRSQFAISVSKPGMAESQGQHSWAPAGDLGPSAAPRETTCVSIAFMW